MPSPAFPPGEVITVIRHGLSFTRAAIRTVFVPVSVPCTAERIAGTVPRL